MKKIKLLTLLLLLIATFYACKKDKDPEPIKPSLTNVEIGLNNNEIGVIGRDFHFNADILTGDRIDLVKVRIEQRNNETYDKAWNHEIIWEQYKGIKNANVHKHFSIPENAVEGKYDFVIEITDENGSKLEDKRTIIIYSPQNLPVDPAIEEFSASAWLDRSRVLYILTRGGYRDPVTSEYGNYQVSINKNERLSLSGKISDVKGDGKIYLLLINKKHNHRPESLSAIDFNKVMVVDVHEHKNLTSVINDFSNVTVDHPAFPNFPRLEIGATNDNDYPDPKPINALKAWESGDYYAGMIYQNTTYNMTIFKYIEIKVNL